MYGQIATLSTIFTIKLTCAIYSTVVNGIIGSSVFPEIFETLKMCDIIKIGTYTFSQILMTS